MANKRPDGDGLVRKRKDGRWEGRIVVGHKANGTPIFRSVFAKTQKMLMEKLHQHIETYRDVELSEECDIPLGEWLDRWKENYAAYAVRPNTLSSYESMIENYIKPRLGMMRISDITTEDIQQMYNGLKENGRINEHDTMGFQLADSSIRRIHMMLHEAMDAAVREHLVVDNPTNGTRIPKPNYPPKQILTEEQVERFMTELENDAVWHDLFYTELTTGLRRGEICGLQWQDLDFSTGKLRIRRAVIAMKHQPCCVGETKTDAGRRTITLPPHTLEMLKNRKKTSYSQWIFPNPVRPEAPMAPSTPYHQMKRLLKQAGLPSIRFHDLRHPYVKHTTKIFSLRLMDFQAQAYPDARRKTCGACQLHRGGQSQSPVRPLCNRKRFSYLPPQSKISWILYATSIRLSGYTSTRSISSSASSVVSVSASKIALDASLRLSCRACSSCFFFDCANTAA